MADKGKELYFRIGRHGKPTDFCRVQYEWHEAQEDDYGVD